MLLGRAYGIIKTQIRSECEKRACSSDGIESFKTLVQDGQTLQERRERRPPRRVGISQEAALNVQ